MTSHVPLAVKIILPSWGLSFCPACGQDYLVAFSCRRRGLCPSCETRRMVVTAAHLVDHVLPRVPVRQWVLSLPKRVRWFLRQQPETVAPVLRIFLRAVFHEAVDLSDADVTHVQSQVRRRVLRWLARHGYLEEANIATMLAWRHTGGFSLDASVRHAAWGQQDP